MTENDEAGAVRWNEASCDFVMPRRVRQWPTRPWLGAAAHTGDQALPYVYCEYVFLLV